ncbi:MAG: hypothetical protein WC610_03975 [Patescibacteria group bacterium]
MKYYPKIKFGINETFEKRILYNTSHAQWALRPELKFLFKDEFKNSRQKILSAYVDNYYEVYKKKIKEDLNKAKKNWAGVEKYFYKEVDKIFHKYPWPKGNYHAHISIWNMFPRFIKSKIFMFPSNPERYKNKKFTLLVIAHEMLHFITYNYLQNKYKLKPSESGDKDSKFWQFTENLNVLIESGKNWRVFTEGTSKPYLECQKLYTRMKRIWETNNDIDNLIKIIFEK